MVAWEQRKASDIFQIYDDRNHPELPVLSASQSEGMVVREETGRNISYDHSNEVSYKRVKPGSFVIHLRSFQGGFAHSSVEGITSPAYTVFEPKDTEAQCNRFWKHRFMSDTFVHGLVVVTYGIRDGRSINVAEFMEMPLSYPSFSEQKQIGETLDALDSLITLHQREPPF
jgi:type I restriction enzyme S subunit